MGLFGSSKSQDPVDPEVRQVEKIIASDAKQDEKNLNHALKDMKKADKVHGKSIKAADKAQHSLDKAVKTEHKIAEALNKAEHQHDGAIADQRNASKDLELKRQHESRLEQDLQKRREEFEQLQQHKAANDAMRESKLAQIHEQAAQRARAGSIDAGDSPTAASGAGAGVGANTRPIDGQAPSIGGSDV